MNDDILNHLIDIKERLSSIESLGGELKERLAEHAKQSIHTQERVTQIEEDLNRAKGSLAIIKWGIGAPGITLVIVELLKELLK